MGEEISVGDGEIWLVALASSKIIGMAVSVLPVRIGIPVAAGSGVGATGLGVGGAPFAGSSKALFPAPNFTFFLKFATNFR